MHSILSREPPAPFIPCPYIEAVDLEPRVKLALATRFFLERTAHLGTGEQLALQRHTDLPEGHPAQWTDACGTFHGTGKNPADYTELNPGAEWVLPLLDAVAEHSGMKPCRTRIMTLSPGRCLSYHKDTEKWRYHFVAATTTSARFLVENQVGNMPVTGAIYRLRTDLMHTALNPVKHGIRTHIVICVV